MMQSIPLRKLKTTHAEPLLSGQFTIRELKKLLAGVGMNQSLHRHDYFFILALEKGRGKHEIDFTSHSVTNHSVFIMRPGQVHQLSLAAGCEGYLIEFKPEFYFPKDKLTSGQWRRITALGMCKLKATGFTSLQTVLKAMVKEYSSRQEGFEETIRAYLDIFFIEMLRHRGARDYTSIPQSNANEQYEKFLDLLEIHLAVHKQSGQYAKLMHLTPYQLNAITRKATGKTASELIDDQLILESRRYLLATTNQVSQIAYLLGYEDVSYFIRFFKKHTGLTPELYRRQFS